MKLLSTSQVSEMLGVTRMTLYKWRKKNIIKSVFTPTGKIRYDEAEIMRIVGGSNEYKTAILYARVSSRTQRNDVHKQLERIRDWAIKNKFEIVGEFVEIASGLNSKRKILNKILDTIAEGGISALIVEHNDRLTRFGFEFLERYCSNFGCKIMLMNDSGLREDLVKDMIDIIVCFSSKLYGKRTSANRAKKFVESEMNQY